MLTPASDKQSELDISTDGPVTVKSEYHARPTKLALHFDNGCNACRRSISKSWR